MLVFVVGQHLSSLNGSKITKATGIRFSIRVPPHVSL